MPRNIRLVSSTLELYRAFNKMPWCFQSAQPFYNKNHLVTWIPCLLSGCLLPRAPVGPQRQCWQESEKGSGIFFLELAQNQPLAMAGCNDGLSHPSKLHFLPLVQVYLRFSGKSGCCCHCREASFIIFKQRMMNRITSRFSVALEFCKRYKDSVRATLNSSVQGYRQSPRGNDSFTPKSSII